MSTIRSVFRDNQQDSRFKELGYLVMEDVVDPRYLDSYHELIRGFSPSDNFQASQKMLIPEQSYHCTFFDSNMDYRRKVYEAIKELFNDFVEQNFADYKIIQANVFIKPPNSGYVYPHQNLTVVDEEKYTSISLWCPFQDTNVENGTMQVYPGSQKKYEKYRNADIYWPLLEILQQEGESLLHSLDVRKGSIVAIDDSIIHTTPINRSQASRFVFHAMLIPKEASAVFCDLDHATDTVRVYEVDDQFWQYQVPGFKPELENLVKTHHYDRNRYYYERSDRSIRQV